VPRLHAGDRVALVCPAAHLGREREALLADALGILRDWQLDVLPVEGAERFHLYLAGTDVARAEEFQRLYSDPTVKGLFAARGGYGTMRMLPHLEAGPIANAAPKPVVGFSDITALHLYLHRFAGITTFHGPCLVPSGGLDAASREADLAAMYAALFEGTFPPCTGLTALNEAATRAGSITGTLLGGSLTLMATSIGTRWQPGLRGALLVLEDVDEAPYRIDRMVTHLRTARLLDGLAGIALGQFTRCDAGRPELLQATLADLFGDIPVPVVTGLPMGHEAPNRTLPLGAAATLTCAGDGTASLAVEYTPAA
jgi:muramoyltetrapeptide carboxypeptidase